MTTPTQLNISIDWGNKESVKTACHEAIDASSKGSNIVSKEGARILLGNAGCEILEPCADMAVDYLTDKSNVACKDSADKSVDSLWERISGFVSKFF